MMRQTRMMCSVRLLALFMTLAFFASPASAQLQPWKDYEAWLRQVGFRRVRAQPLERDHGLIEAVK